MVATASDLARKNLHIIPTLVCLITPVTFIVTFILSVYYGHVFPLIPYISDTGANFPESCVFSQFLNIAALLLSCCVYVRGLQVDIFATFKFRVGRRLRLNTLATYIGYVSCLGLSVVANFQVNRLKPVHYIGAAMCFLGGAVYFIFQTMFSYYMGKEFQSKCTFITRCVLCSCAAFFLIVAITAGIEPGPKDSMHWKPTDPGYNWHIISTSAEWLLALTQSCLVLTFFPDFKCITVYRPEVHIEGISMPNQNQPSLQVDKKRFSTF